MLNALLLLGLLPVAASIIDGDDDEPTAEIDDGDLGDTDWSGEGGLEEMLAGGEDYQVSGAPGVSVFDGFKPGVDLVKINMRGVADEFDIECESDIDGGGACLHIETYRGISTFYFPELEEVPVDDIAMKMSHPVTGKSGTFLLSDLLPEATGDEAEENLFDDDFLAELNGDAPEPVSPGPSLSPVLSDDGPAVLGDDGPGLVPDLADELPAPAREPVPGLRPVLADEGPSPTEEEDFTPILMDDADPEAGEAFDVMSDGSSGIAEFPNFRPGVDGVHIGLDSGPPPDIWVGPSANGVDGEVRFDGKLVALLRGAPGASMDDVYVKFG